MADESAAEPPPPAAVEPADDTPRRASMSFDPPPLLPPPTELDLWKERLREIASLCVWVGGYLGIGCLFYMLNERHECDWLPDSQCSNCSTPWTAVDSMYFAVVTMTTVGYGDLSPQTGGGRYFTILYQLFGIIVSAAPPRQPARIRLPVPSAAPRPLPRRAHPPRPSAPPLRPSPLAPQPPPLHRR